MSGRLRPPSGMSTHQVAQAPPPAAGWPIVPGSGDKAQTLRALELMRHPHTHHTPPPPPSKPPTPRATPSPKASTRAEVLPRTSLAVFRFLRW